MYSEILSKIRTKEEAEQLRVEIDVLLDSLYEKKGQGFEETLRGSVRSWVSEFIRTQTSKEGLDKGGFLKGLKTELDKFKVISLTLAYEPTDRNLDRIHEWVFNNIAANILIEVVFDPKIIAGAKVTFKGNWRDYSFGKKLDEVLEGSREEIIRMVE